MRGNKASCWTVLVFCCLAFAAAAKAVPLLPNPRPVTVLMLSDLHFDPYRDPAKVPALRAAPVMSWSAILNDPDSRTQAKDFAALQTACHARGVDSSWSVVDSSLKEAQNEAPSPLFVTVSGDLLTHNFDCRLKTLDPSVTAADISAFAAKTIDFLALTLRDAFPGKPVYLALGNNDSGCTNYHQSPGSAFVKETEASTAAEFSSTRYEQKALKAFSDRGDYSVLLPKEMGDTRLIVLQDVFESPGYGACTGEADPKVIQEQNDWLREQLISAKRDHEKVWVMAHISPGVDTYASFHKYVSNPQALCPVNSPTMLLRSDDLAQTLLDYASEVKLAIFAHTHMDEMKLLHNAKGDKIAVKLIPSISPVDGNVPAFVVAKVQPSTAVMQDYTVFAASDLKATSWKEEYRYSAAFRMPDYSAASVAQMASRMAQDKTGADPLSETYQRWFFPGDDGAFARGLKSVWSGYACAVEEDGGRDLQDCICGVSAAPASTKAGQ